MASDYTKTWANVPPTVRSANMKTNPSRQEPRGNRPADKLHDFLMDRADTRVALFPGSSPCLRGLCPFTHPAINRKPHPCGLEVLGFI